MKITKSKITKGISMNKLKMQRGYSYISSLAIPFLVATQIAEFVPEISWLIIFALAVVIVWVAGHLDWKYFWKNELEYSFLKNPEWIKKMKMKEIEDEGA